MTGPDTDEPAAGGAPRDAAPAEEDASPDAVLAALSGEEDSGGIRCRWLRLRSPGLRRTGAVLGVAVIAGLLFFSGFAARALTQGNDLDQVNAHLTSLDQKTGKIQSTLNGFAGQAVQQQQPQATPNIAAATRNSGDDPSWGPKNAVVQVQEFADFQCPFCSRFVRDTLGQLKQAYGDKIHFVYRDYPIPGHQFAEKAAEAGGCANEQGRFWDYHDLLFTHQSALSVDQLKQDAASLGMDTAKFNQCLDSGNYANEVSLDLQDGRLAGVSGTPSFVINGTMVTGAQPFASFQQVIDRLLSSAQ